MNAKLKSEDKIRRLTENQAKALSAVVSGTLSGASVTSNFISDATQLDGRALGGTVSALERNDFIRPIGRNGREFKWELSDSDLIEDQRKNLDQLNEIINKVSGEK